MKRKIYIFLILMFISSFSFKFLNVEAKTDNLQMSLASNIYYTRRGGGKAYSSNPFPSYKINGEVAYCIEPGVLVTTSEYSGTMGVVDSPYSDEINKKIQLIGHYGYEYPGHNNQNYLLATQALIWETVTGQIIEYFTERYGYGDEINVTNEKNIIMSLVNNHYNKPNFSSLNLKGKLNVPFTLEDTNGILSNFEVVDKGGNDVKISGNNLIITPKKVGSTKITLKKKRYDSKMTMIFKPTNGNSQIVAKLRAGDEVTLSLTLETTGGRVEVQKLDSKTKLNVPEGMASLKGAIYGIYTPDNELVMQVETNAEGLVLSDYLPLGNYKLKEIKPSPGYLLDETVYEFQITEDNLNPKVNVYEKVIENDIKLYKVLGDSKTQVLKGEANIQFDIYLKGSNEIYESVTTDSSGYVNIKLPYGTYIFKQVNTTNNYLKVEDFEIVVDSNLEPIEKTLYDIPIKARLKVIKKDLETGEIILRKGFKFKLKDLATNEYVCENETCTFETNEEGFFLTNTYLFGDYELLEMNEDLGDYLWNSEPLKIHIGSDTIYEEDNIVTYEFKNKHQEIEVPSTGMDENITFKIAGTIFLTLSLSSIFLSYRKRSI